jgi:hypothetical protein
MMHQQSTPSNQAETKMDSILDRGAFARINDTKFLPSLCLPYSQVPIVTSAEYVSRIASKGSREHPVPHQHTHPISNSKEAEGINAPLHPFSVIRLSPPSLSLSPDPHRSIPRTRDELGACRRPVAGHYSCYVPLVDLGWRCQLSDVECIEVVIF